MGAARVAGSLGHRSVSQGDGCWTGHEREHGEMGKRCRPGERRGEGERQMDRGVREAAGYRQGRNCVSGACCQKYVSIMQIGGEKKREREASNMELCIAGMAGGLGKG